MELKRWQKWLILIAAILTISDYVDRSYVSAKQGFIAGWNDASRDLNLSHSQTAAGGK